MVVLDPQGLQLKNFSNLRIAQTHELKNIFWCVSEDAQIPRLDHGPQILRIRKDERGFQLDHLMTELWNHGLRSLFVEGGAQTFAALIESTWVHRLYLYQAPHLMGAGGGLSWTHDLSISQLKDRWVLKDLACEKIGEDLLMTARFLD